MRLPSSNRSSHFLHAHLGLRFLLLCFVILILHRLFIDFGAGYHHSNSIQGMLVDLQSIVFKSSLQHIRIRVCYNHAARLIVERFDDRFKVLLACLNQKGITVSQICKTTSSPSKLAIFE